MNQKYWLESQESLALLRLELEDIQTGRVPPPSDDRLTRRSAIKYSIVASKACPRCGRIGNLIARQGRMDAVWPGTDDRYYDITTHVSREDFLRRDSGCGYDTPELMAEAGGAGK